MPLPAQALPTQALPPTGDACCGSPDPLAIFIGGWSGGLPHFLGMAALCAAFYAGWVLFARKPPPETDTSGYYDFFNSD